MKNGTGESVAYSGWLFISLKIQKNRVFDNIHIV
ncbi:MAG: hypothetical protein [Bacteroides phage LoVEphage]|nr:MAG: hypothetical protein [Bacteroides phage LoVEphage]